MIDFHAHCLPAVDDGAANAAIALQMLVDSKKQGVDAVVATPHFYPDGRTVEHFLEKRDAAYGILNDEIKKSNADVPEIILASEVRLGYSILEFDNLDALCIDGTRYMLIEMPYTVWSPEIYELLYSVMIKYKVNPVMAHIERYIEINKKIDAYRPLFDLGVMIQANAEGFLEFSSGRFLAKLVKEGFVHVLGSDMHNLSDRKSRMAEAVRKIEKKFGKDFVRQLEDNASGIIGM